MTILRTLNSALGRLAHRMQGQEIERENAAGRSRLGADYTAIMKSRQSQGISPLGFGR